MSGIHEVQKKVTEFFTQELGKEAGALRFLKVAKAPEGWEVKLEATETNEYLKKLGHPQIFDRNIYTVRLDASLEVIEYGLTAAQERSYATEEREDL